MRKRRSERRQRHREATKGDSKAILALHYAQAGFEVVPLHGMSNGRCTCGNMNCNRPGKHPRTKRGIAGATADSKEIKRLWSKWPKAKIGIVLGGVGKLLALVTSGETGRQGLRAITTTMGSLRRTVTIRDHNRTIRIFRVEGKENQPLRRDVANGVRILGGGSLVVAPSTVNESTNKRRFLPRRALGEIDIAKAPGWLIKLGAADSRGANLAHAATGKTCQSEEQQASRTIVMVPTSDIAPACINWIWPGIIASGSVTGLVGYPGLGKSQVATPMAGRGRKWERRRCDHSVGGG